MNPFWLIDEASLAGVLEAQPGMAAAQPNETEVGAPFLGQIEQLLGEEAEPDAAFFIDSWTVGVGAASESLLRRQQVLKSREHEVPWWNSSSFFTPLFVARPEAAADAAWPPRQAPKYDAPAADLPRFSDDQDDGWQATDQVEMARPLTLESAYQVLGVTATSTREEIRAAYRKMASRYHPDRLPVCRAHEQKLASDRMATINEAYRLLCAELAERRTAGTV